MVSKDVLISTFHEKLMSMTHGDSFANAAFIVEIGHTNTNLVLRAKPMNDEVSEYLTTKEWVIGTYKRSTATLVDEKVSEAVNGYIDEVFNIITLTHSLFASLRYLPEEKPVLYHINNSTSDEYIGLTEDELKEIDMTSETFKKPNYEMDPKDIELLREQRKNAEIANQTDEAEASEDADTISEE